MSTVLTPVIAQPGRRDLTVGLALILLLIQVLAAGAAMAFGWIWALAPWALLLCGTAALSPRIGVYILVLALYFKVGVPGLRGVYPADILTFCVMGGTFAGHLASGRRLVEPTPLTKPFLVFLAVAALASINAEIFRPAIVNWLRHLQLFILCLTIITVIEREDIERLWRWMLAITLVVSLINILRFIAGGGDYRIFGITGAFFAAFLSMAIAHCAVCVLFAERRGQRFGWGLLIAIYGIALIATQTRAAWLQVLTGLSVLVVVLWWWSSRKRHYLLRRRVATLVIALALTLGVVFSGAVPFFRSPVQRVYRAFAGESFTIHTRLFLWKKGLEVFVDSPLLGTGLGQVKFWDKLLPGWRFDPISVHSRGLGAHNDTITYLSETGIVGLAVILWLFARVTKMGWRALWRSRSLPEARAVLVIWIPVCAIILRFFFGTHTLYSISGMLTAVYFAMLAKLCMASPGQSPDAPLPISERNPQAVG